MVVQLVILSDVRLYREGLAMSLSQHSSRVEVVGTCSSAEEVLETVRGSPETVVLVDLASVTALSQVRRLGAEVPGVRMLALAVSPEAEGEILAAAEAGMTGYVPPEASVDELLARVAHAARGEMLCTPRVAGTLARRLASLAASEPAPTAGPGALTAREREVLELLHAGLSNKQIARQLSIRLATVKNHVHSILAKLNVKSRDEAGAAARAEARSPPRAVTSWD